MHAASLFDRVSRLVAANPAVLLDDYRISRQVCRWYVPYCRWGRCLRVLSEGLDLNI